ncbi:hypothetical protein LCGC14_1050160, partial [marine sediment metagenome]
FEWRPLKVIREALTSKGVAPVYSQSGWYLNGKLYNYRDYPPIDLNNLFKYAVPKLVDIEGRHRTTLILENWALEVVYKGDPALALFWAIYPILKEANNEK